MAKVSWGLARAFAFDGGDEQGAGVKDGGDGGDPGLVVVLGAVVTEDGVGNVRFEHFRTPAFPFGMSSDGEGGSWPPSKLCRRSSSPAVGGEPARASRRAMETSRLENAP